MTTHSRVLTVLLLVAATAGAASAQTRPTPASAKPTAAPSEPAASVGSPATPGPTAAVPTDWVIGPEDLLQISVWRNEALSREVAVRPDGKISLPLLHDIQAAGLTAMQLRDKIALALTEIQPNAEVTVIVRDVRSFRVSVLGEVQRPGVLVLKSETTILEAIAMAGGFRDFASPSKIVLLRKDAGGATSKIRFNYHRALTSTDQNFTLQPGDVIVVP